MRRTLLRYLAIPSLAVVLVAATSGPASAALNLPLPLPRALPNAQQSTLSTGDIERLSANADKRSIVIFKNQHPEAPPRLARAARAAAINNDQFNVRNELAQLNTRDVKSFQTVNALAATISSAEATRLAANPDVQAVVPDVQRSFNAQGKPGAGGSGAMQALAAAAPAQQICPSDPSVPLLEPEALEVMNVEFQPGNTQPAAHNLADGAGVKVGIVADGLDPNNPDLIRANGQHVIFDYQDFSGFGNNAPTDGRESFLDSSAIASQGNQVYDLSGFVNPAHPLPPGCNIRIKGVAPGVSLAVMNLSGPNAGFFDSTIIQGIDWAVTVDDVDVLNESIGGNPIPDTRDDPVQIANAAAVAAGVVVVVSTGDAGPTNTIGSPASGDGIIAAAGTTTYRVYRQTTRYDTQLSPGGWVSNNVTALSSAGTTEFGARVPDVSAPGDRGWSLCSSDTAHYFGCADIDHGTNPPPIWAAGGTSMSCPLVSGTAALVIQAYRKTHSGATPKPDLVKRIIVSTADDLGAPAEHQGAGLVNSLKAVQLAMSIRDENGAGTPTGNTLLVNKSNLNEIGPAGAHASFNIQVTNRGTTTRTLSPSLVALNPRAVSEDSGTVTLSSTSPTLIDGEGNTDSYTLHQFTVPAGVDYLNGDIVWDARGGKQVFETLFDPAGRVAAYSLLNGQSGHGHVEVRQPTPGTWTAVIFTVHNAAVYSGPVQFDYVTQQFRSAGSVSPGTKKLQPGETANLRVDMNDVNTPGDHAASLRLTTGGPNDGVIPVVVRTLVPVNGNRGSFSGVLTGGADPGNQGQRLTYQFQVPAGMPSLNLGVTLRDPNVPVFGFLIDPDGEALDIQSTQYFDTAGNPQTGRTLQFFHRAPERGRWTVSLSVRGPLDGRHLSTPFSGTIDFQQPRITARGLPDSERTRLTAGTPVTATIDVTNTGNSTKLFFADPRLRGRQLVSLAGVDVNNVALPLSLDAQPNWLVPPHSNALFILAQGSVPIVMDVSQAYGDPDVLAQSVSGNAVLASVHDSEIAPTFWFGLPEMKGPFPPNGSHGTVNLAAAAMTNPFDTTVVPDTGDLWLQTVDPTAPFSPIILDPGQTGRIQLTITPTGPSGTVVRGFIGVDTFDLFTASGDELENIAYSYTIR